MIEYVIIDLAQNITLNGLQVILKGAFAIGGYLILKFIYFLVRDQKPNLSFSKIVSKYLFICYIISVLYLVLFSREAGSRETVNLRFFGTYSENPRAQAYMFENILLFIPFGFMLPILSRKMSTFTHSLFLGMMFSLTIEITQYITKRGYFQIDDIWLNTIGSVLGFVAALIFMELCKAIRILRGVKIEQKEKSSQNY